MRYKILDNGTAVVLARQPELVCDELFIDFSGAPSGATVIFNVGGCSLYRSLEGESCSVPADKLDGVVKVTLALLDGSARPRKWSCEELLAQKQRGGDVLVAPNDMNLPQRVVELKLENESIRRDQKRLEERIKELEGQLKRLLEGYDLT